MTPRIESVIFILLCGLLILAWWNIFLVFMPLIVSIYFQIIGLAQP